MNEFATAEVIFFAALERKTPAERNAYLNEACQGNAELRAQVDRLLAAHPRLGDFLEPPSAVQRPPLPPTEDIAGVARPGLTIAGRYLLEEKLGEGGMGEVWVARQTEPVKRKVALKLIKAGMDTRAVLQRFEAERQALALMDHPNIAKVHDGGMTDDGRPYFVMEIVAGQPLNQFCDQARLTPRQRLELFVPICQAVQHAHQKGIVHRDLKPSNILVTLVDGVATPKVIDFGVAKAMGGKLTEDSLSTQFGAVVGTLEYMSPEQAGLSTHDIDTRADVYSLGVILYELLTGLRPFDSKRLKEAALHEVIRIIREEDPPSLASRLSTDASLPTVAAVRQLEPGRLLALVRGELDWIVRKCLEKDRNRRYESANGLARDVQRFLADEPVEARPVSAGYRFRKFVRRHRGPVAVAATLAVALLAGMVGTTWGLLRAEKAWAAEAEERKRAETNEQKAIAAANAEKAAKESAETQAAETRAVLGFVENKVFAAARPENQEGGLGHSVSLRKAVEAALPFVEASFKQQPLTEARLRLTLGRSFWFLGDDRIAIEQFEKARATYGQHHGPNHVDTLSSVRLLANAYERAGRINEALKLREESLAIITALRGPDHQDTLVSMSNLAVSYFNVGRYHDSARLHEKAYELQKIKLGEDHEVTLRSMGNVAGTYEVLGRHQDALNLGEAQFDLVKKKYGPDHPETLFVMSNLASMYTSAGRLPDAVRTNEAVVVLLKAKLGVDHPDTLHSKFGLGLCYAAAGRFADAIRAYDETLPLQRAKLGPDHPDTLKTMMALAISYDRTGRGADAYELFKETFELQKAKLGPTHPDTLKSMRNLAASSATVGQHAQALKLSEEALALRRATLGPKHPDTLSSLMSVAWLLATTPDVQLRDPARAVELAAKSVEGDPTKAHFHGTLGVARYRAGDWKGARAALEQANRLRRPEEMGGASSAFFLAMTCHQLGEREAAREWFTKGASELAKETYDQAALKRFRAEAAELLGLDTKP
jgi:tetratricopeptide (TPR) repeat protein